MSFHSAKLVKKIKVPTKINDIVNRLNRTKQELYPDLAAEKDAYDREVHSPGTESCMGSTVISTHTLAVFAKHPLECFANCFGARAASSSFPLSILH